MIEAAPAPAFEVIQPQLVLQFLIVALDPPAQHREPSHVGARGRRRQGGEPILDRRGFPARPLDEQALPPSRGLNVGKRLQGNPMERVVRVTGRAKIDGLLRGEEAVRLQLVAGAGFEPATFGL